jgi:hypothetical protein
MLSLKELEIMDLRTLHEMRYIDFNDGKSFPPVVDLVGNHDCGKSNHA